jgi:hypothetical protein
MPPIDPNSVVPRIDPLDPADVAETEQKIVRQVKYRTVGTGSLASPGTQGAEYGHNPAEVLP